MEIQMGSKLRINIAATKRPSTTEVKWRAKELSLITPTLLLESYLPPGCIRKRPLYPQIVYYLRGQTFLVVSITIMDVLECTHSIPQCTAKTWENSKLEKILTRWNLHFGMHSSWYVSMNQRKKIFYDLKVISRNIIWPIGGTGKFE